MPALFVYIIILLLAMIPAIAQPRQEKVRTVKLILHPAKAPEPTQKYRLLPNTEEQSDADASMLYEKAAQSLPKHSKLDKIIRWSRSPLNELPCEQVQLTLQQLKPSLQLLQKAAKCKRSDWSTVTVGTIPRNQREYRMLVSIIALQARFQIAQNQYDKVIGTIQTGFAMARHLAESPALVQGLLGVACGEVMCRQLEQFVQGADAPNLYWALQNLPRPLVDLTNQIELEIANLEKNKSRVSQKVLQDQLKAVHERIHQLMNRLDRHIGALQCVEAIRLYAAAHNGKFPNELSDVTEVTLPDDPFTQKLFIYRRTASRVVLEAPVSKKATARDAIRYELKLKE